MTQEKPLVTWKQIAAELQISEKVAKELLDKAKVPVMYFGRRVAIYPSTLRGCLEAYFNPPKDPL